MPELVFLRRGEELLRVALDRSRMVLGRGETCDVVLPHRELSWHHAAVLYDGRDLMVEDLSGQGTVVSGVRARRTPLLVGGEIALGPWAAVVREPASTPPPHSAVRWGSRGSHTVRIFEGPLSAPGGPLSSPAQSIIGADPSIRQLAHFIEAVATSPTLVAIFGEPGSGRELVARAIHARSTRREGPFLRVNCRALRTEVLETELFGSADTGNGAAGSGAFGEASDGTLFLDDVGALPLELQGRFLGKLPGRQARSEGCRVVVATHQDLLSATRAGRFREDLYERLCLAPLVLPPLRRRPGDLPTLAQHFLCCFSPRGQQVSLTPEAQECISRYAWPGNVRELQNVIRRALLSRSGPRIGVDDLGLEGAGETQPGLPAEEFVPGLTLEQMLRQREREIVESALRRFDNNRERVARELGVARSTLFKRLKDWGLTKHGEPEPPPGVSPAA